MSPSSAIGNQHGDYFARPDLAPTGGPPPPGRVPRRCQRTSRSLAEGLDPCRPPPAVRGRGPRQDRPAVPVVGPEGGGDRRAQQRILIGLPTVDPFVPPGGEPHIVLARPDGRGAHRPP